MDVREKLVELLTEFYGCDPMYYNVDALAIADYLISHGVAVQKHGRWFSANDGTHFCSECGYDAPYTWDDIDRFFINSADDVPDRISNYCPNCGAKMDKEDG